MKGKFTEHLISIWETRIPEMEIRSNLQLVFLYSALLVLLLNVFAWKALNCAMGKIQVLGSFGVAASIFGI
jgi:hypothetical protein